MSGSHALTTAAPACFCAGALYGWSALAAPLQTVFGVSTSQVGLVFSLAIVAFTGAVLMAPTLSTQFGQTRVLVGSAGAAAILVGCSSVAPGFGVFLACFSLGFGAASGAIYSAALSLASASGRARLATPLMVATFGLGGVLFGPLWTALVADGWGLSALWPLSGALLLAGLLAAASPRRQAPTLNTGARHEGGDGPLARDRLALIWGIVALGTFPGLAVIGLAANVMGASGAGASLTGLVLAGVAAGNTLGRLSAALSNGDRHQLSLRALYISCLLTMAGLAGPLFGLAPVAVGIGLVAIAFGYGLMASAVPLVTAQVFGPARFPAAFGVIFTAWGTAGFVAPWVLGWVFDLTGSFTIGFVIALISTIATLPLIALLDRRG